MPFVYKISSPSTDKVYIGSTTRSLNRRFSQHKGIGNNTRSKEIIALGDAVIECLEKVDADTMKERERYYIELMREKCVNHQTPLRTQKEWCKDNEKYVYEYHHNLYTENKQEINERNKLNYEKNKDKYLERQREWWRENVEVENEKRRKAYADMVTINCECGGSYKKKVHNKHLKLII